MSACWSVVVVLVSLLDQAHTAEFTGDWKTRHKLTHPDMCWVVLVVTYHKEEMDMWLEESVVVRLKEYTPP